MEIWRSLSKEQPIYLAMSESIRSQNRLFADFPWKHKIWLENSRKKLKKKHLDMIVANNLKEQGAGFGTDTDRVTII